MNRIPVVALAVVSAAAFAALLFDQPASRRVFAASPAQLQAGQPDRVDTPASGQGQSKKGLVITLNGTPLTPDQLLQLEASGLQDQIKDLQAEVKTDETTIHTLQSSLQTLQTQFANHSHKVSNFVPGHACTGINQFLVTQAGTGRQVQVGLEVVQACSNPKWNGSTPSSWENLNVSTPVQGAQTPQ